MKPRIREVIVVEGRYDKAAVSRAVDAVILETSGFGVFNDREKRSLLRRMAEERGLVLLTDSDGAGFVIRNYLKGVLPPGRVRQAYIPDVYGKEHRKARASREGKLGVEGMPAEVILTALRVAGVTFLEGEEAPRRTLTKLDLYELGLSGTTDAAARRKALLKYLDLPEHLSSGALLEVLSVLFTRDELSEVLKKCGKTGG